MGFVVVDVLEAVDTALDEQKSAAIKTLAGGVAVASIVGPGGDYSRSDEIPEGWAKLVGQTVWSADEVGEVVDRSLEGSTSPLVSSLTVRSRGNKVSRAILLIITTPSSR